MLASSLRTSHVHVLLANFECTQHTFENRTSSTAPPPTPQPVRRAGPALSLVYKPSSMFAFFSAAFLVVQALAQGGGALAAYP